MPEISFPTPWLKILNNVFPGDLIRFNDSGRMNEEGNWVFEVTVIHNGKPTETKDYQINKTNFKAVAELYGSNSDNWVGKEMLVEKTMNNRPGTGERVPSILLVKPIDDPLAD